MLYGLLYGDLEILIDEIGVRIDDSTYAHNESPGRFTTVAAFDDGGVETGRAVPTS